MTRAVTLAEIADTNTFIVDGTNNRVGIASTIPTVTLDVDGVVKATSFTGSITGSASGLTGTPDITVRNITGVAATFTGVLTYEDVTNIDSIGIITARSDLSIADKIIHTGDTNTAIRFPAADTFTVETGGSEALRVDSSQRLLVNTTGAMETFGSAALQVATSAGGTLVLGREDSSVSADNGLGAIYFDTYAGGAWAETAIIAAEADAAQGTDDYPSRLVFKTTADGASSVTERFRINSSGVKQVSNGNLNINSTYIDFSGDVSTPTTAAAIYRPADNTLAFSTVNEERLRITSAGLVRVPDNGKFTCGAGDDLQIYHDGSDNYIKAGSNLEIWSTNVNLRNTDGSEYFLRALNNGEVQLFHNHSEKLRTSATGVTVTGTLNATTDVQINGKGAATTGKAIAMAMVFG